MKWEFQIEDSGANIIRKTAPRRMLDARMRIEFTLCMEWPASDGNPLGQRCGGTSAEQWIVPEEHFVKEKNHRLPHANAARTND